MYDLPHKSILVQVLPRLFLLAGLLSAVSMWIVDVYINNLLSVILAFSFFILVFLFLNRYFPPLGAFYALASSLPFIHLIFYFNFDYQRPYQMLWGLAANKYMYDERYIGMLLVVAIVWLTTTLLVLPIRRIKPQAVQSLPSVRTSFIFAVMLIGAIFAWSSAPSQTLFQSIYMSSAANVEMNFASAWALSYFLLLVGLLLIDERLPFLKSLSVCFVLAISLFFGLLRGDRESITLILAILVYFYVYKPSLLNGRLPALKASFVLYGLILVFVVNGAIGAARSSVLNGYGDLFSALMLVDPTSFVHGTWSAVLLTPLSVLYDLNEVNRPLLLGRDYFELILSLPPGFIADLIGYERPWSSISGPSHEMMFGLGGTHISVLPLRNFGLFGVFLAASAFAFIIRLIEVRAYNFPSRYLRIFYISLFMMIPHWVWYSEKIIINHLIFFAVIYFFGKTLGEKKLFDHTRYSDHP